MLFVEGVAATYSVGIILLAIITVIVVVNRLGLGDGDHREIAT